ncbi:MAG: hypothetical protein LBB76_00740 [Azoarcus sp.]|jgi:hypothetical protein|nr:hypothetical protein [Azoarcus sp.]
MARTLLGVLPDMKTPLASNVRPSTLLSPVARDARLRQKRSSPYIQAMAKLDAGGHTCDRQALETLLVAIQAEFPELSLPDLPQGIVARCHLGAPYEVHTLDRVGAILQHYKSFEPLPADLERARSLALHPGYSFVEVYPDRLIAVAENGDTSLIRLDPKGIP